MRKIFNILRHRTPSILPVIQSLWIGEALSPMEQMSIRSFLKNGHPYHLYVYHQVKDVPEGTTIKDANEILPEEKIFKYRDHDSYAGFANMFRYKLLYEKGDFWSDTDMICLTSFSTNARYVFSSERLRDKNKPKTTQANNGVIKAPKASPIMEYCYHEALSKNQNSIQWGETGPKLLSRAIEIFGLEKHVTAPNTFCPIDWYNWKTLIEDSIQINTFKGIKQGKNF